MLRLEPLGRYRDYGPTIIRAFMATFLVYMTQDNVFSPARMLEFVAFLRQFGFPAPLVSAHVSVYVQFIAALLLGLGLFVRPAAAMLVVNFIVAIVMVHTRLPFREALDPSAMLAGALSLLVTGAGALSLDGWLSRRARERVAR